VYLSHVRYCLRPCQKENVAICINLVTGHSGKLIRDNDKQCVSTKLA